MSKAERLYNEFCKRYNVDANELHVRLLVSIAFHSGWNYGEYQGRVETRAAIKKDIHRSLMLDD